MSWNASSIGMAFVRQYHILCLTKEAAMASVTIRVDDETKTEAFFLFNFYVDIFNNISRVLII